ncbi:MAG: hypothetical protein RLZ56_132 [Bacteroidota bacterium]|jgi:hypothetical protein
MKLLFKFVFAFVLIINAQTLFAQNLPDTAFTLKEATVKKKLASPVTIVNDRYVIRGMFRNMVNVKVLDFIDNPPPNIIMPIMEYLRGKIAGLYIEKGMNGNYVLTMNRVNSMTDDGGVKLYVDEQLSDPDFLYDLYPKDVAMVKYFPPGGSLTTGGAASSATLAIYTRKGEDLFYYENNDMKKGAVKKIVDSLRRGQ